MRAPEPIKQAEEYTVIDTRPMRLTNSVARRAWLRMASSQAKTPIAPQYLERIEKARARRLESPKKP